MRSTHDEIIHRCDQMLAFYAAGDAASMANIYTADAEFLAPGMPRFVGRPGIQKFWQSAMDTVSRNFENLEHKALKIYDDVCIQVFTFDMTFPRSSGEMHTQTIKNVLTWERDGDDWLINLDVWNSPA